MRPTKAEQMKISNRLIELEVPETPVGCMTIRFLVTRAEVTVTLEEARELWASLDTMFGD